MLWQFDCPYIKSQWHVWSKGLLHNCFPKMVFNWIAYAWYNILRFLPMKFIHMARVISTLKKNANPVLCYVWKENYHYIFNQVHPPYLVSISCINFIFLQLIHSFIHSSIHSSNFHFWNCTYQHIVCMYVCMYVHRFQNVFLRCPTPRLHCFLSSHWPSFRFLAFMAFFIPSIQFFFSLPHALFCFGIHLLQCYLSAYCTYI